MACNSSPLIATDLEMIYFTLRKKQKINQFSDLIPLPAQTSLA